jgi:hypothetical protein
LKLLEHWTLTTPQGETKRIELYEGDLTRMSSQEAVDILVVSAFPNDFAPTSTSLIGALHGTHGISLRALAGQKQLDLTQAFQCWLSRDLTNEHPNAGFRAILCFEPGRSGDRKPASELVGNVFRSLLPIIYDIDARTRTAQSVAMPLLASGDQGEPAAAMMSALLEAASQWLALGVPLDTLKIVELNPGRASAARKAFQSFRAQRSPPAPASPDQHDVFISYAHEDSAAATEIADRLTRANLQVFIDGQSIDVGLSWQSEIFSKMDSCRKIVTIYSPDYFASEVCREELNVAYARRRKAKQVMVPLYLRSTSLPTYLELIQYIDAREGTSARLDAIWPKLGRACRQESSR